MLFNTPPVIEYCWHQILRRAGQGHHDGDTKPERYINVSSFNVLLYERMRSCYDGLCGLLYMDDVHVIWLDWWVGCLSFIYFTLYYIERSIWFYWIVVYYKWCLRWVNAQSHEIEMHVYINRRVFGFDLEIRYIDIPIVYQIVKCYHVVYRQEAGR